MDNIQDDFLCDNCANKDFIIIYNFSLFFHKVNFSDDLMYDRVIGERYQCTKCRKTFTKRQIEEGLSELKRKRRNQR